MTETDSKNLIRWNGKPEHRTFYGPRNDDQTCEKLVDLTEIDTGYAGRYRFKICGPQGDDDTAKFRAWVYGPHGVKHIAGEGLYGGFQSIEACVVGCELEAENLLKESAR